MNAKCEVPPSGWVCSRAKGHEGPCAASPAPENKPLQFCKTCGTNVEFYQCFCNSTTTQPIQSNSVAITARCELGEHCRCKTFDVAYKVDCWNWIGEVKL